MTSPQDPPAPCPVSVTDCPQCGALCLGAITLPCGHLSCRRCCRQLLHQPDNPRLTCRSCKKYLPLPEGCSSVSQVMQQLGTDPVVQDLVQQRLRSQGGYKCHVHQDTDAIVVCEDCHDCFCDTCSDVHSKQTVSTDHVLQPLSTAGLNTSSASSVPPRPRADSTSSTDSDLSIGNMSEVSDESSVSFSPLSSQSRSLFSLPSRDLSRDESEALQRLREVVTRLQQASRTKHAFVSSLKEMASVINQVVSTEGEQDKLLQTYTDRLSRCHDVEQIGPHTFVITDSSDDLKATMNIQYFEERIINMIDMCQSTSVTSADRIRAMIHLHSDVFHQNGEWTFQSHRKTDRQTDR